MTKTRRAGAFVFDGVLAGMALAALQMLALATAGQPMLAALRATAGWFGGGQAADGSALGLAATGFVLHCLASGALGYVYHRQREAKLLSRILASSGRLRPAVSGITFGLLVWAFGSATANLAAAAMDQAVTSAQAWWAFAFGFGLPLGLLGARTERLQPVELKVIFSEPAQAAPKTPTATSLAAKPARSKPSKNQPTRPKQKRPISGPRPPLRLLVRSGPGSAGGNEGS